MLHYCALQIRSSPLLQSKFNHADPAVGNVLNRNPYAPKVPCHRVVRSDGTVGGYAKGAARKRTLLRKEGAIR